MLRSRSARNDHERVTSALRFGRRVPASDQPPRAADGDRHQELRTAPAALHDGEGDALTRLCMGVLLWLSVLT